MTTIIRFPPKAKTGCTNGLPPYPGMTIREIVAANDRFAEIDRAVDFLFARHAPTAGFLSMAEKTRLGVRNYARRCVTVAGMLAWNEAARWQQSKMAIRKRRDELLDGADALIQTANRLLATTRAALEDVEQRRGPKIGDAALIEVYVKQSAPLEKLKASLETILLEREDIEDASADLAALDPGREDVLSHRFIEGLAANWRDMTGRFPATARSGPFVDFVDKAWTACGWDDYSQRTSLGKRIFGVAREHNWSRLNAEIRG